MRPIFNYSGSLPKSLIARLRSTFNDNNSTFPYLALCLFFFFIFKFFLWKEKGCSSSGEMWYDGNFLDYIGVKE